MKKINFKEAKKSIAIFMSGFIIVLFLVLFTVIVIMNKIKNNDVYKGYTYKNIYNYYLDSTHEIVGLSTIGYKDNSYISNINVRYDIVNDELITTPIDGYNSEVSTIGS